MVVSKQKLSKQLAHALGQNLSEREISSYIRRIEFLEPKPGKPFWQSQDAPQGIYLILGGKVRLLDRDDNLIASVGTGASFGELTLFPQELLQPYTARASFKLKLAYLNIECLQSSLEKFPSIQSHLYHQAIQWELFVLCRQVRAVQDFPVEGLRKMLSQMESHDFSLGKLPEVVWKHQQLWLLRQGELQHSSGQRYQAGNLYLPGGLSQQGSWRVTQPGILHTLSSGAWEQVSSDFPQLKALLQTNSLEPESQTVADLVLAQSQTLVPSIQEDQKQQKKLRKAYFPSPTVKISQWWQQITHRYPFFQQQSATDCGIACLVMIGRYWHKRFDLNQLRSLANVNRDGASLKGLITAAESMGFAPRPVHTDLKSLGKQRLPAIVHWRMNHYIVVYQVKTNRVIVADPEIGRRTLSYPEFQADWAGYTLLLEPTAKLKKAPEAKQNLWKFFDLLKPHWLVLFEVLIASVMIQVFGLVTPLMTQLLLDRVVVQRSSTTLFAVGIGLLIFSLFKVAMSNLRRYLLYHTAHRIDLALIVGFINHTFQLPLSYFENRYVGDITSRIRENTKIRRFIMSDALTTILDLLTVFIYLWLMFWYSWKMAIMALVIVPISALSALIATPFLRQISREVFRAKTIENSYLIEALTGIGTIKAIGIERTVRWRWEDLFNQSIKVNFSGKIIRQRFSIFNSVVDTLLSRFLLVFGVWQVINNQLTIGQLIAFNMLVGNVISPCKRLISLWNDFQEVVIAVERINDVIDAAPEEDLDSIVNPSLPVLQGNIRFEEVTFRYSPESESNTLENVSFTIKPGQTVALVGRSGSGKTTISKLILGLYLPSEGKIFLDGQDLSKISLRSLRQQVGVVDQNTFLFGGTIRENLTIAHPEAHQQDLESAAKLAGAAEFIDELPMKYETKIGEGGGLLSGGQRQRLAIARALLGNPRLLIFDEATSNLDSESERIIQNNLQTICQNRTTVVIAHRLSTVRNADLILVLDKGVLVESGTHAELMGKRGQYFYLNQQQLSMGS